MGKDMAAVCFGAYFKVQPLNSDLLGIAFLWLPLAYFYYLSTRTLLQAVAKPVEQIGFLTVFLQLRFTFCKRFASGAAVLRLYLLTPLDHSSISLKCGEMPDVMPTISTALSNEQLLTFRYCVVLHFTTTPTLVVGGVSISEKAKLRCTEEKPPVPWILWKCEFYSLDSNLRKNWINNRALLPWTTILSYQSRPSNSHQNVQLQPVEQIFERNNVSNNVTTRIFLTKCIVCERDIFSSS
ncbi:hypothetical protein OUZ56_022678 [Daphnia magna]|uniref:Uncharacterized protein n=1 Tax=Daphnia magna TaxID=35525 RepID=A0ABR0AX52_9CRUS|nr:hypothetical protein OUZ56_022678 [Daphnia magna]